MNKEELIKENFLKKEQNYSKYATKSSDAIRLKEEKGDMRPAFFHDIDRIIHKLNPFVCYRLKPTTFRWWEEPCEYLAINPDSQYTFV
jgi:hypothetical protein